VSRTSKTASFSKLAVAGVIVLALAGCGRKGGLDLPPDATSAQVAPKGEGEVLSGEIRSGEGQQPQNGPARAATAQGNVFDATRGDRRFAVAPRGEKKRIILDPILD
jgi:predicted small lipoprotein YifL